MFTAVYHAVMLQSTISVTRLLHTAIYSWSC